MIVSLELIANKVEQLKKEAYTGAVKLGIEKGAVVAVSVFNNPKQEEYIPIPEKQNIIDILKVIDTPAYYGTVGLFFVDGELTKYFMGRTYQDVNINSFFKPNRRVIAVADM